MQLWVATCRGAPGSPAADRPPPRWCPRRLGRRARSRGGRPPRRSPDPDHGQDGGTRGAGRLPVRAPGGVPRRQDRPDVSARLHVQGARRADPRLRRRDLAGGAEATAAEGLPSRRPPGQERYRGRIRLYLRGRTGLGQIRVDSLGRQVSAYELRQERPRRLRAAPDDRRRVAARSRGRARATASTSRTRTTTGRPTAARSSRSTPATAPSSRWPRIRRTSRPSSSAGSIRGSSSPCSTRRSRARELAGDQQSDRGPVSAGLDLEAGRPRSPAMQEHVFSPYDSIQCTPYADVRPGTPSVSQLEPVREPADDARRGARRVLRHLLLRDRQPLLRAAARKAVSASSSGRAGSASERRRASTSAARRRDCFRRPTGGEADVRERLGSRLEPRRLDPARDRPEGPPRDPAADGALLRDARERRERRDAVPRRRTSSSQASKGSPRVVLRRFAPPPPRPPASTRSAHRRARRSLSRDPLASAGRRAASSANYAVPISGKTGTAEKVVQLPGYPADSRRTSRGGVAGAPPRTRSSSSAR